MYEARAKRVSPEGVDAYNFVKLASEANINQAKLKLDNPSFLNKPQVQKAIAIGLSASEMDRLSEQIIKDKNP